jgi:3-hydroxyacyl-CoA dehydrogenase
MDGKIKVGTIGLGLMGSSIATCLLAAGHQVTSVVKSLDEAVPARERVLGYLKEMQEEGLLPVSPAELAAHLIITDSLKDLSEMPVIIESVYEDAHTKKQIYAELEKYVQPGAIIGSNTSAIPVSILQAGLNHPERFLGIHWAEPAHITRFMEIICGDKTDLANAEKVKVLAEGWGKEPSVLRKDIRGFITNRIMYAMIREAFHLVEKGYATYEDVDRSLRNDLGAWITFAGPFRFMDLTGIQAYATVMEELFPELDNSAEVPVSMRKLVAAGAQGVRNAQGFYPYSEASAREWEKCFTRFSFDIRKLAEKYPGNIGDRIDNADNSAEK